MARSPNTGIKERPAPTYPTAQLEAAAIPAADGEVRKTKDTSKLFWRFGLDFAEVRSVQLGRAGIAAPEAALADVAEGGGVDQVDVSRHQRGERLLGILLGVLPEQCNVIYLLHLPIRCGRKQKRDKLFSFNVGAGIVGG